MCYLCNAGPSESYDDGHYIDSKLKLQELGDAVVHISPPHDSFHNAGEVIIGQDDVRGFFSYISTCYTLETAKKMKSKRYMHPNQIHWRTWVFIHQRSFYVIIHPCWMNRI